MKASLKNYRQSPRKVRLVANAVKGKAVVEADAVLSYMIKRGAEPIKKLIKSAVTNAVLAGANADTLVVKNIEVNKGFVLKRAMPRAMGSSSPINKRTSHVTVTLAQADAKKAKKSVGKSFKGKVSKGNK
jgi:large subunit ribosomal protein L22